MYPLRPNRSPLPSTSSTCFTSLVDAHQKAAFLQRERPITCAPTSSAVWFTNITTSFVDHEWRRLRERLSAWRGARPVSARQARPRQVTRRNFPRCAISKRRCCAPLQCEEYQESDRCGGDDPQLDAHETPPFATASAATSQSCWQMFRSAVPFETPRLCNSHRPDVVASIGLLTELTAEPQPR